jgi:hypothetical protein
LATSSTLVHKEFASPNQLKAVKTVLPNLLTWLHGKGYLDSGVAESQIEDVKAEIDRYNIEVDAYVEIRKFVNTLIEYVENETGDVDVRTLDGDEWVQDEYLRISEVTDDSITFDDWGTRVVGPIPVPAEIAEMARSGWEILLTAVRTSDKWRLIQVVNGEA